MVQLTVPPAIIPEVKGSIPSQSNSITVFSPRYQKNLQCLYVVHPTFRTKFMAWWFTTFTAPEIKHKVNFLNGVEFLYDSVSPEQLDIPQFIMDWDSKVSPVFLIEFL